MTANPIILIDISQISRHDRGSLVVQNTFWFTREYQWNCRGEDGVSHARELGNGLEYAWR